ncbi:MULTISPECIES: hypothetical protein [Nitrincola]|uniref:Tryptophan synthase subunit beta like protein n=1 Tax=Nitrincola nitratireducens TaxID=1229521 RepID=W9UWC9_9GAMM|nr:MULTISPECIES: hypothetical protein [Nitrincola]EXJ11553.1 hypothetical protein D791_01685 [Nitrincola nitratireducens]
MYVKRNHEARIIAVSVEKSADFYEWIEDDASELISFLPFSAQDSKTGSLAFNDTELIRVVDDLIDLLTEKQIIQFTELPQAAQLKLLRRQTLRKKTNRLDLLSEDSEEETIHLN